MTTDLAETRRCRRCGKSQPLAEYRLRRKGQPQRVAECRRCHNEAESTRRTKRSLRRNRAVLSRFSRLLNQADRERDVRRLTAGMVSEFGGVGGLMRAWMEHAEASKADNPGGRATGNAIAAMLRLIEFARPATIDLSNVSDDDLRRELRKSLGQE